MRLLAFLLLLSLSLHAEQWVVIGHNDLHGEHLTKAQIKAFYLGQKHYFQDQRIIPLNLPPNETIRQQFEQRILEMSRDELHRYWIEQHYLGKRPPKVMASYEALLRYVETLEGAIAYVPLSSIGQHPIYVWYLP